MKNLLIVLGLMCVLGSCNESAKSTETEETIPTNRLDAITSLENIDDTAAVKDTTVK